MSTEIQAYSELSNLFLDNRTDYFNDKQIIKRFFSINGVDHQETIRIRLTIIDSYYSTNMSRRYYGIQNISKKIFDHYTDDNSLKKDFHQFVIEPFQNGHILALFKSLWVLGVKERGRFYFWGMFISTMFKKPKCLPMSIRLAIQGFHFRKVADKIRFAPVKITTESG